MTDTTWLVVLTLWIVCAIGSFVIASQRGAKDPGTWAFVGFLFGPFGLLAAGLFARAPK